MKKAFFFFFWFLFFGTGALGDSCGLRGAARGKGSGSRRVPVRGADCSHCAAAPQPARAAGSPKNRLGKEGLLGKVSIRVYPGFRPPRLSHR